MINILHLASIKKTNLSNQHLSFLYSDGNTEPKPPYTLVFSYSCNTIIPLIIPLVLQ